MKYILFFFTFFISFISFLVSPHHASAFFLPFAGKVVTVFTPGVVCVGEGPITIKPISIAPFGPYVITLASKRYPQRTVSPGSWIIGMYSTIPIPGTCDTTSIPPVPVPASTILFFGSSFPSL
ncbi:MAG: hypothetical protein WCW78_01315 [Candidatus Paceibacterota bacterium]|jgi:hypothetical protein